MRSVKTVANGWTKRTFGPDSISPEVDEDKAYPPKMGEEFEREGIVTRAKLAFGDPLEEIVTWGTEEVAIGWR